MDTTVRSLPPVFSFQGEFSELAASMGGQDASFNFKYDEPLSHLIYAAADIVVVPSMFEPCGLTQMIAMRYGAGAWGPECASAVDVHTLCRDSSMLQVCGSIIGACMIVWARSTWIHGSLATLVPTVRIG
jgi:hypothetical protein